MQHGIERYFGEAMRLFAVLEGHLADSAFVAEDEYSYADVMMYPWVHGGLQFILAQHPDVKGQFPSVERWATRVGERDAVRRGMKRAAELESREQERTIR